MSVKKKPERLTDNTVEYDKLIDLYVTRLERTPDWQRLSGENKRHLRPSAAMDAKKFIDALIAQEATARWTRLDEWSIAIETHILIAKHVHDPHDWDHISTAIELTEWIIATI